MIKAILEIKCDFCQRSWKHLNWRPDVEPLPGATMKIINKDVCRECLKNIVKEQESKQESKQ